MDGPRSWVNVVAGRTNERTTGHWDSKLNNRLKKLLFCKRKTNICFIREIQASIVVGGREWNWIYWEGITFSIKAIGWFDRKEDDFINERFCFCYLSALKVFFCLFPFPGNERKESLDGRGLIVILLGLRMLLCGCSELWRNEDICRKKKSQCDNSSRTARPCLTAWEQLPPEQVFLWDAIVVVSGLYARREEK